MAVAGGVGVARGGSTAAPPVAFGVVRNVACNAACCSCDSPANHATICALVWGRPSSGSPGSMPKLARGVVSPEYWGNGVPRHAAASTERGAPRRLRFASTNQQNGFSETPIALSVALAVSAALWINSSVSACSAPGPPPSTEHLEEHNSRLMEHDWLVEAVDHVRLHPRGHRVLHAVRAEVLG